MADRLRRPPSRPSLPDRLGSQASSSAPSSPKQSPRSSLDSPTALRPSSVALADQTSAHPVPVLHWFSNWSGSNSGLGTSSCSPDLTLLREALQEPLVTPPPMAKLPPLFRPRNLTHPPSFLDTLTRSTLPTSSLSPPLAVARSSNDVPNSEFHSPPIVLNHSPPHHTSVDTLRRMSLPPSRTTSSISSVDFNLPAASSLLAGLPTTTNLSWWFSERETTSNSDLLSEEDRTQSLGKKYKSTSNPVIFCHGLLGFDSVTIGPAIAPLQVTHWRGIKEVLEQNGSEVLITRVPATSSYVDRARVLEERISQAYPGRSVHLIGHSMGGLDCRYLTSHLTQRKFNVLSITTIATPHRGSSFADHFLKTVGPERMPSVMAFLDLLPNGGGDGKAFECLTVGNMKEFNEQTPDVDGVRYFSWGAAYEPGLIDTWKWPHSVILEKEGPNDGLVSIESAKWGTYLGTLNGVNHLDLVGWINTARYKWAEIMGKEIKFRPATFYLGIVDMLAREVEHHIDDNEQQSRPEEGTADTERRKSSEKQQREQMVQSLEDAGGEIQEVHHTQQERIDSVRSSLPEGKVQSSEGSKTSSGSVTPRAPSVHNAQNNMHAPSCNAGSITPRSSSWLTSNPDSKEREET